MNYFFFFRNFIYVVIANKVVPESEIYFSYIRLIRDYTLEYVITFDLRECMDVFLLFVSIFSQYILIHLTVLW